MNKVCIVDNSTYYTGAFKSINYYTEGLKKDICFTYCVPQGSELDKTLKTQGYNVYSFNFLEIQKSFKIIFYLPLLVYNSLKLRSILRKNGISILHVNDLYNLTGVVVKLLMPSLKLIYHVRLLPTSYLGGFFNLFSKIILLFANRIISVSTAVTNSLPRSSKIQTLFDFIALPETNVIRTKETDETIKILYVGNLVTGKGHDLAVRAFQLAFEKNSQLRLVLIGKTVDQLYRKQIEEFISANCLSNYIDIREFSNSIETEIKESDILLNLSLSESFSFVCYEALFYGLPVISSDCGGPSDLIINDFNGFLVPVLDYKIAAKVIVEVADDKSKRIALASNAKSYIRGKIATENVLKKLKAIYVGF
jgi:L-malate glycosyltransferase